MRWASRLAGGILLASACTGASSGDKPNTDVVAAPQSQTKRDVVVESQLDDQTPGFVPSWELGDRWKVYYAFFTVSTEAANRIVEVEWIYEVVQQNERRVTIEAESTSPMCPHDLRLVFSSDGRVLETTNWAGVVVAHQEARPFFSFAYGAEEFDCAAPWWPLFPLRAGTTERFDEPGLVQSVREEEGGLVVTVRAADEGFRALGFHDAAREMVMVWEQGRPWWSSLTTGPTFWDLSLMKLPAESYQMFQIEGQVVDWDPPERIDGPT